MSAKVKYFMHLEAQVATAKIPAYGPCMDDLLTINIEANPRALLEIENKLRACLQEMDAERKKS